MKPIRWIIALAIAAAALCIVYFVVDRSVSDRETREQAGNAKTLFSFDSNTVSRITLENEEGYFAFDWDSINGTWKLVSADQFNFNTYAISTICNYFCELSSEKTVVFDCQNTDIYGFDDPVTLKVYTSDKGEDDPYVLYVGDNTPTYDAYYAMTPDSNDVYTIGYTQGSIFCAAKNTLKNLYLFDTYSTLVNYFELINGDVTTMILERDSDSMWQMAAPKAFPTYNAAITTLMDTLVRIQVDSFVDENPTDLAQYGLDNPKYRLKLGGVINSETVTREIWFGDMVSNAADETQMFGYFADSKQVFTITAASVSFLDDSTIDYIMPYCVDVSIDELSKVEIDLGDIYELHETMYLDYANEQYALGDLDIDALEDDDILTLYQNFFRAVSNLKFTNMDLDAVPEGDAVMSILYTHLDGTETHVTFIPQAENNFYLMVNGEYTGLTVRLNRFTGSTGMVLSYEALLRGLNGIE